MKQIKTKQYPRALTIAGSDSGGGAGIQADLKTFAALGVHGMSAITAVTAQNTRSVAGVFPLPSSFVAAQIESVYEDIGFDAVKTGMLYDSEIIKSVARFLKRKGFENIVVDPVMVSKSRARLLRGEAIIALKEALLPLAMVVTPNADEALELTDLKRIKSTEEARSAARKISEFGPRIVVVKGGHLDDSESSVDVVYYSEERAFEYLRSPRIKTTNTHGTGCVFSSAIAAELAKGNSAPGSLRAAKEFVTSAIRNSLKIGSGHGPVNPTGEVLSSARRFTVLSNLGEAVKIIESNGSVISRLIPELRTNIGMALEEAKDYSDVAAIPGRITALSQTSVRAAAPPEFGASRHVANSILAAMNFDRGSRAAMNIRYDPEIIEKAKGLGLVVSPYDRRKEPSRIKRKEGSSTFWGATTAIANSPKFPDLIYHKGDFGKEPMIVLLGKDAISLAKLAVRLGGQLR
ncbi:MAG: bifunctional hydroxymethylpyrimidine kinase/phosphomethylpyrimidine kinase [Thaumarchaeota archaeon]|nr:bifunctional hydroxymethylpyrimidine kinase/phosphomethylpyrimidine kinase [Nitrososphaerota archaeon]